MTYGLMQGQPMGGALRLHPERVFRFFLRPCVGRRVTAPTIPPRRWAPRPYIPNAHGQRRVQGRREATTVDVAKLGHDNSHADDAKLLARLSPSALTHWPAVAKQIRDAGVLNSVDAAPMVRYLRSVRTMVRRRGRSCHDADRPWSDDKSPDSTTGRLVTKCTRARFGDNRGKPELLR